jgi:2-methylcitrate dehydratase PrpD
VSEPRLRSLARWIAGMTYEALPEETRRAARYQVLNMIAAAHAGARSEESAAVKDGLAGFTGLGRSTVLATGQACAPGDAALANAAFSMAQDFDDIVWMGHTCHSAVFAPLAVCEHEGRTTAELLTAVVIANEIGGRLGASSFLGPLNGQMWTFIHLIGAAAATAWLLRLDEEHTTHALAIALAQPTFALQPGFMAPSSKLLAAGTPAATGIQAAYFARAGMTGAEGLLEDRRGFWARFSFLPMPFMLDGLGEFWAMQTLSIKTFPGCHYFQTAASAIGEILQRTGPFAPDAVRAVKIATTKLGAEVTRFAGEYAPLGSAVTPVNANFDLATTAAIFLHAGRLTSHEMEGAWLAAQSGPIRAFRDRIKVRHDPALTAQVVASARAVSTGRDALAQLQLGDLARLAQRYRKEYRSTLLSADELAGWAKLAGRSLLGRKAPAAATAGGPVPLRFPNRVTIELVDGRREEAQVDLPVGSFASPAIAAELETKFLRETASALGARAPEAFAAGLRLESVALAELIRLTRAG